MGRIKKFFGFKCHDCEKELTLRYWLNAWRRMFWIRCGDCLKRRSEGGGAR